MEAKQAKSKILLVEDEELFRDLVIDVFTEAGFEMLDANNGEEGFQQAKKGEPDLILLDLMMPKMDGFSMLKKLQNHKKLKNTSILVLTNLSNTKDLIEGFEFGLGPINKESQNYFLTEKERKNISTYFSSRTENGISGFITKYNYSLDEIVEIAKKTLELN